MNALTQTFLKSTKQLVHEIGFSLPINSKSKGHFKDRLPDGYVDIAIPYIDKFNNKKVSIQRVRESSITRVKVGVANANPNR